VAVRVDDQVVYEVERGKSVQEEVLPVTYIYTLPVPHFSLFPLHHQHFRQDLGMMGYFEISFHIEEILISYD
jgi:hypothetical protein